MRTKKSEKHVHMHKNPITEPDFEQLQVASKNTKMYKDLGAIAQGEQLFENAGFPTSIQDSIMYSILRMYQGTTPETLFEDKEHAQTLEYLLNLMKRLRDGYQLQQDDLAQYLLAEKHSLSKPK